MSSEAQAVALSQLIRLSPSVYLQDVPLNQGPSPKPQQGIGVAPPDTILICSWNNALLHHVAKYISGYTTLYPEARIVLVTNETADVTYRSLASQKLRRAPALAALLAQHGDKLLVHVFSNGGAYQITQLARSYRESTGQLLPIQAMVLDSCPGRGTFQTVAAAFAASLPKQWYFRTMGPVLIYILLGLMWIFTKVQGWENTIDVIREDLNDPSLVNVRAPRCYLYSETDPMVGWDAVEEHYHECQQKGYNAVVEKFSGSGHVSHVRVDGKRYWNVVRGLWERAQGSDR